MNTYENGLYTAIAQTNDTIEKVDNIEEGKKFIALYEKEDKKDGNYVEDYYSIIRITDGSLYGADTVYPDADNC